jgi:hypothetical protein
LRSIGVAAALALPDAVLRTFHSLFTPDFNFTEGHGYSLPMRPAGLGDPAATTTPIGHAICG